MLIREHPDESILCSDCSFFLLSSIGSVEAGPSSFKKVTGLENSGAGKAPPCSETRRSANRPTLANGGVTVFVGTSSAGDGAQGFGI